MSARHLIRVIDATLDDGKMDCEDNSRVHVWLVCSEWSTRRAFLTQGEPLLAALGWDNPEDYSENVVYNLIDERFFAEFELPTPEAELAERIELRNVEPSPDVHFSRFDRTYDPEQDRQAREAYIKKLLDDQWLKGNIQRQRAYVHDAQYHHDIRLVFQVMIALDTTMADCHITPTKRDEVLRLAFGHTLYQPLIFPPDVRAAIARMEQSPFAHPPLRGQR